MNPSGFMPFFVQEYGKSIRFEWVKAIDPIAKKSGLFISTTFD